MVKAKKSVRCEGFVVLPDCARWKDDKLLNRAQTESTLLSR